MVLQDKDLIVTSYVLTKEQAEFVATEAKARRLNKSIVVREIIDDYITHRYNMAIATNTLTISRRPQ